MAGNLQPLDQKFAIVDARGNPTDYFIRWAQQKQIDIGDSITLGDLQTYLTEHSLQEGSGIQFTPDGDLNNRPTIAADVQEILDQLSATRGTVIYRGLLGWSVLLPGTAGFFLQTNGIGADPSWAAGGGGGGGPWWWAPPLAADFPTFFTGAGSPVAMSDDPDLGLKMLVNNAGIGGFVTRGIGKAVPAGAFSVECRIQGNMYRTTGAVGLFLFESGTNKIMSSSLTFDGNYYVDSWNGNLTSFFSRGDRYLLNDGATFLKVEYDGATNYSLYYSENGKDWLRTRQVIRTTPFTAAATHVGLATTIGAVLPSAALQGLACDRWVQSF